MRALYLTISIVTAILVVLLSDLFFQAEAVEHHGFKVDVNGSRNECISCHDGVACKPIPECMPICLLGESHPINRVYPPSNRKKEFKTVSDAKQNGIMLVDNKMDCISCHSLVVNSRYHLRIKNREQQICYACHNKM